MNKPVFSKEPTAFPHGKAKVNRMKSTAHRRSANINWARHLVLAGIFAVSFLIVVNCSHQIVEPEDFVDYDTAPQVVKSVQPVYPEIARKAGLEGTVWVKIWVGKDGKPKKIVIQKSASEIFDQPSIDAAMQFLFTPAIKNGRPVDVWVLIPFHFRLNGDATSPGASSTLPAPAR